MKNLLNKAGRIAIVGAVGGAMGTTSSDTLIVAGLTTLVSTVRSGDLTKGISDGRKAIMVMMGVHAVSSIVMDMAEQDE